MGTHFAAGSLGFTRRNVAAVAGVVALGQQKIPPAIVTAAGRVARRQATVKIRVEEVGQIGELRLLRQDDLAAPGWVFIGTNFT